MKQLISLLVVVSALSNTAQAQNTDGGDEDDPVQWIIDEGFSSIQFMQRCLSIGGDGSVIDTEPLPVGDDRKLLCKTYKPIGYDVTNVQANDGKVYCVLGELNNTDAGGDDRLELEIIDEGQWRPAWIEATAEEPITISMVSAFGGAQAWPVWLTSNYDTLRVVPDPGDGRSCRDVFGL